MVHPAIPLQYSLTVEGEYVVKMRLEPAKVSPAAYHAMLGLESFVNKSSKLEVSLLELVNLSLAIITINGWNRLAIGFRKIPGEYQPHKIG